MDRLRSMKVFAAVARTGSFSRASRELSLPLSTVSRILAALEAGIGSALVLRTTRHLSLTPAGETYLALARRVLEDIEAVEDALAGRGADRSGHVVMTAPVVFGRLHVLPLVLAFLDNNPKVDVALELADHNLDLAKEGIDIAVRIGALRASALLATRVGTLHFVTCAAPGYLRRHGRPLSPPDLLRHHCVGFAKLQGARWQFESRAHGRHVVKPSFRLTVSGAEAAIDAAIAGLGVTRVLSYQADAAIRDGRLLPLLADYEDRPIPIHLVRRKVNPPKPLTQRVMAVMGEELRAKFG